MEHLGSAAWEAELQLVFLELLCEYLTRRSLQVDSPEHKTWSVDSKHLQCEQKAPLYSV